MTKNYDLRKKLVSILLDFHQHYIEIIFFANIYQ